MSQEQVEEAIRLEDTGHNEQALALWRELAEAYPTKGYLFLRLGRLAWELGLNDEAERAFTRAVEIEPNSALAPQVLGDLSIQRGDFETAVTHLRKACATSEHPSTLSLFGVALRNSGHEAEAEQAHRTAIRIDPNYEEAYYNLGVVLKFKRPTEAEPMFRKALELDPDFAPAHRELGFVLNKLGRKSDAEQHLRKALELDPEDVWAHIYLGNYLWASSDLEAALEEFRAAVKLKPTWPIGYVCQGDIYETARRDFDRAQSLFEEALRLDPEDEMALWSMGRLMNKRGQKDLARQYLERLLVLDPDHKRARTLLSKIETDLQRPAP